jgi:hypothetical protein
MKTTAATILLLFSIAPAFSQTSTWTNGDTNFRWGTLSNWDNGVPDSGADAAIFSGTAQGTVRIVNASGASTNFTFNQFNLTSGTYTFGQAGDGTLTASGSIGVRISGGVFSLGTNDIVANSNVFLQGGSFRANSLSNDFGTGHLSNNNSASTIEFTPATGGQTLRFDSIQSVTGLLTINGYSGDFSGTSGGTTSGRIVVDSIVSSGNLGNIQFQGFAQGANLLDLGGGSYELVPVPEPMTLLAFGSIGLIGAMRGFRMQR